MNHCVTCATQDKATMPKHGDSAFTDAVFVPDFTFFALGRSSSRSGGDNGVCRCDEETSNMSAELLQEAYDRKSLHRGNTPKAVMTVDLFGLPAAYPQISDFARNTPLMIIEDASAGLRKEHRWKKGVQLG